ncbi:MAG: SpoIIE family protein phosphatase [Desulfobacterales bacterium]|nr:SpoIIE family protein phosphatase [Desulfobacterales bacterium]
MKVEKERMNSRIFIADDDKVQLHLYRRLFSLSKYRDPSESSDNDLSFNVELFQDGAPLVELFRTEFDNNRRIPLCIIDIAMPSMDGIETAETVRKIDPEVFIIIATGRPDIKPDELLKNLKNDVYFIRKPMREEELLAQATSLLTNWNSQQELKKAHRQFQTILEYSPAITAQQDIRGRYQLVNQRFTDVFGLSSEQVINQTDEQIFPRSTASARTCQIREVIESGKHMEIEEQIPVREAMRTYLTVRYPIFDEHGKLSGIGSMSTDITDRKEAEKEIAEKEEYLRTVMTTIQTGVMIIEPESLKIADANPCASHILGCSEKDLKGRLFSEFQSSEKPDPRMAVKDEYILQTDNKKTINVRMSSANAKIKNREYIVQSLLDITDIRYLIRKQGLSIDLAKHLLKKINSALQRYTRISEDLVLFADAVYAPCFKEGGDHYFIRNFADSEKTVISLKDQSGHEVGCIMKSITADMIHHEILDRYGPEYLEKTIGKLNNAILKSDIFRHRDFFTSVNAVIDHQTLEMKYVLTGHPRFFLIRGKNITGLPESGKPGKNLPIPLCEDTEFTAGTCQLQEGDKLVFYTDGLVNMSRKNGKSMMSDDLENLVKEIVSHDSTQCVSDVMMELLDTVSEMSGVEVVPFSKNTSDDDITILCCEIENRKDCCEKIFKANDLIHLSRTIKELNTDILDNLNQRGYTPSRLGIRSIMAEIISNAWVHGSKKSQDKPVTLRWRYGNDFHIEVADQGEGFNFQNLPDPLSDDNINKTYGRGIFIIRHFSNTVQWKDNGRRMFVSVRKYPEPNMQPDPDSDANFSRSVQSEAAVVNRRKDMKITVNREKDHTCFVINGEIDEEGADILDKCFRELDRSSLDQLVLDFKEVHYIGSAGIGQLILLYKEVATAGAEMRIKNTAKDIYDLLLEVNINTVMEVSKYNV